MEAQGASDRADHGRTPIGRGWCLATASWRLTWRTRTVLLLAMIGGCCGATALAAAFFAATGHLGFRQSDHPQLVTAALLALYPLTFLVVFLDIAMAAAANASLEGARMGAGEALRTAHRRGDRVALWAVITVVVSVLLRLAGAELPGQLAVAIWPFDLLWVLATIFVVPLLALEDAGLREALRESGSLLRRSWGENLTGLVVIGVWSILMLLPASFLLFVGFGSLVLAPNGGGLIVVGVGLLGVMAARGLAGAFQQVFAVALYRYASSGSA